MNLFLYLLMGANVWLMFFVILGVQKLRAQQIALIEAIGTLAVAVGKMATGLKTLAETAQKNQSRWN